MAVTPLGWAALNAPDSLGAVCNALANAAVATSAAIDNTEATVGHAAWTFADVWLVMSAAITTGAGAPYVQAVAVPTLDGTNYPPIAASNGQIFPVSGSVTTALAPSTACTTILVRGLPIPPTKFEVAILNESGVAFAATVTASLYRGGYQAG